MEYLKEDLQNAKIVFPKKTDPIPVIYNGIDHRICDLVMDCNDQLSQKRFYISGHRLYRDVSFHEIIIDQF